MSMFLTNNVKIKLIKGSLHEWEKANTREERERKKVRTSPINRSLSPWRAKRAFSSCLAAEIREKTKNWPRKIETPQKALLLQSVLPLIIDTHTNVLRRKNTPQRHRPNAYTHVSWCLISQRVFKCIHVLRKNQSLRPRSFKILSSLIFSPFPLPAAEM